MADGLKVAGPITPRSAASDQSNPGFAATSTSAGLPGRAARGTFWLMLSFGVFKVLGFATNFVLARLLDPADFGLVSFAMIVIGALTLLRDLGVPEALVYDRQEVRQVGGTALVINVAMAVALATVLLLGAPYVAQLGGHDEIRTIIGVLAIGLVVEAGGAVQRAWFMREMAFRRGFLPGIVPVGLGSLVSICLALLGFGAWSLVWGYFARTSSSTVVLWLASPIRPWPAFHFETARRLLGYGWHVSLNSVLGFMSSNLDYFIIGTALGAHDLGIYTMAFTLAVLPSTAISENVSITTFPAYSRLRERRADLHRMFLDTSALTTAAVLAMGLAMYLCAPTWVPLVLGEKWRPAVGALSILIGFGVLRALSYTFSPLYKAVGKPDLVWKVRLIRLAISIPIFTLAVRGGIEAVAAAQLLTAAIFVLLNAVRLTAAIDFSLSRYCWHISRPLAATGGAALLVVVLSSTPYGPLLVETPLGSLLLAALALAVYSGLMLVLEPRLAVLTRGLVGSVLERRRGRFAETAS